MRIGNLKQLRLSLSGKHPRGSWFHKEAVIKTHTHTHERKAGSLQLENRRNEWSNYNGKLDLGLVYSRIKINLKNSVDIGQVLEVPTQVTLPVDSLFYTLPTKGLSFSFWQYCVPSIRISLCQYREVLVILTIN